MFSHARRGSAGPRPGTGGASEDAGAIRAQRNRTGLPDALKIGMERESGLSLDRVRVRYNSTVPARFDASAMARGLAIDVAPGQERSLSHELGHVVQQMRGHVRPTARLHGMPLNDEPALEAEADWLGARALRAGNAIRAAGAGPTASGPPPGHAGPPPSPAAPVQLAPKSQADKVGSKSTKAVKRPADEMIPSELPRAAKRPVNYGIQMESSGFRLSRDKTLIYPRNPAEIIGKNAAALWDRRKRKGMSDAHTRAILANAREARATGATAYTRQESNALGDDDALDLDAILGKLSLSGSGSSRNHKLADSAVYAILANMLSEADKAGRGWGHAQERAVADLVQALHGNGDAVDDVRRHMNGAAAATSDRDRGWELSEATFLASHGASNLRLGDAEINGRVLNAYDPNFANGGEFVGDDGTVLSQDDKDELLEAWKAATQEADQRKRPAFRRRGTMRSEAIREAVLKLARDGLIETELAEASVTGVYDRETGEPISSSAAVN